MWAWSFPCKFKNNTRKFMHSLDPSTPRHYIIISAPISVLEEINSTVVQCLHEISSAMESHVELSRLAWVLLLALSCLLAEELVHASDPDPLQDFCVADFSSNAPRVDGYSCKLRLNVLANDCVFTSLRSGPAGYGDHLPHSWTTQVILCL